jgi:hypothetical protein
MQVFLKRLIFPILFIAVFMQGCVESPKGKRTSKSIDEISSTDPADPTFTSTNQVIWYTDASDLFNGPSLTVQNDINTVLYIAGESTHSYLGVNNNDNDVYCIVASYSGVTKKQVRVRAVPIEFNNIELGILQRILRVDIHNPDTVNDSTCSGTVTIQNSNPIDTSTTLETSFNTSDVCITCSDNITSTNVSIYKVSSGTISDATIVSSSELDILALSLRISFDGSTNIDPNGCTNSSCQNSGFDCCIEGQCANDAALKPNASTHADYIQALAEVTEFPQNFINWPEIYFVCPNTGGNTPIPTATPDAEATADAELAQLIRDKACLDGAVLTIPDYSSCDPTFDVVAHDAIKLVVLEMCGCAAIGNPPPNDPANLCPDYGLDAVLDPAGTVVNIICLIPDPNDPIVVFQDTEVSLSYRSSPHLFYKNSDGAIVDDITTLVGGTESAEGTAFAYLDENNKTNPENGSFNFNSVTGQFAITLDKALPAKLVNVTNFQSYIISINPGGNYTPCPLCSPDSWFPQFLSHPPSLNGGGLEAFGHITNRENLSTNFTKGNYADTKFGRACWLPPSMIPFSHKAESDLVTQRKNRLSTQAAMYINGYQRDWFGFNKGAIIGSFNGINWFAIGKSRRIQATSEKLYLAINSPFSDLANNTSVLVQVRLDQGGDTVANYDYEPGLEIEDPAYNNGASCRKYHQCDTDADCVTQLGWEYSCADYNQYRSYLPSFNADGSEVSNSETSSSINQILHGVSPIPPGLGNKRCVYRGSGAPCKGDYSTADVTNTKKLFKCAPNFYCSKTTNSDFNNELVRTVDIQQLFFFGMEADFLGRPLNYVSGSSSLELSIRNNLNNNALQYSVVTADWGLCRAGKQLTTDYLTQHQNRDNSRRTDYISQISSCNSNATGDERIETCPSFGTDEIDPDFDNIVDTLPADITDVHKQNMCGAESLFEITPANILNPFDDIEAPAIPSILLIDKPMVARDACLRRSGSVCHTNLDCGPNRLHAEQAEIFDRDHFGNTEAEQQYWQESLICGQADPVPQIGDTKFETHDLTLNRCCREVGSDMTMYTQTDNILIIPDIGDNNTDLNTDLFSKDDPKALGRYSRYQTAAPLQAGAPVDGTPEATTPLVNEDSTPHAYQWKTFSDTGKNTCCGGGWVRKFADGTHDWTVRNRLQIPVESYECLNYETTIHEEMPLQVQAENYALDFGKLCLSPADTDPDAPAVAIDTQGGCIQVPITSATAFEIANPVDPPALSVVINVQPLDDPFSFPLRQNKQHDIPYMPLPFTNNTTPINDPPPANFQGPYNYFATQLRDEALSVFLPIYIGPDNITSVNISYFTSASGVVDEVDNLAVNPIGVNKECPTNISQISDPSTAGLAASQYCIEYTSDGAVLHMLSDVGANLGTWDFASFEITFVPINSSLYGYGLPGATAVDATRERFIAGNSLYYLTKLGRLELLGIPQIFYEPLYCNNDRSKIIPNIFQSLADDTRTDFETVGVGFDYKVGTADLRTNSLGEMYASNALAADPANPNELIVLQDVVLDSSESNQVFSGHEFTCCMELGGTVLDAAKCCTNYAEANIDGDLECKAPRGTDLNVFFNRFVSSEGVGDDQPGGGFVDDDFVPETGEPKLRSSTYDKIVALGNLHCADTGDGNPTKVRQGAAFGNFFAEPNPGFYIQNGDIENSRFFSIVDSPNDFEPSPNTSLPNNQRGAFRYNEGYKWNHHYYCR